MACRNFVSALKKPKVFITTSSVPKIIFDLLSEQLKIICYEGDLPSKAEIIEKVKGCDALLWTVKQYLDKEILDAAGSQLRVINTLTVGYDHIDIKEIKSRGILVGNAGNVSQKAVAEIAVLLVLAAMRRAHEGYLEMKKGKWSLAPNWMLGQDIIGSTVGLVGLGTIGLGIVKRLKAFEVGEFIYTGPKGKAQGKQVGAHFTSFDEVISRSDVVIAACPYNEKTHEMFNAKVFKKMKPTSVFINIGRGKLVEQDALINALENKTIFAAGLDVMTPEPLPPTHKLYSLPNCFLLPHLGSRTINTRNEMAKVAARNILAVFNNQPMPSPI